ncbi:MAG: rhomboid family intramembrane serine protease [Flavobacteriales bacterium]
MKPRRLEGLLGIVTYPLLHGDWKHITDNSVPAFVLLFGMFSFYGRLTWQVLGWSWVMSAVWMWVAAREGNHIGFSGVIYALASFIFFSGVFRRYYRLMALSLIVVFLYGSMVWGVLPIQPQVSWEGHLFGAIAGFILAVYLRNKGPQRPQYSWELEEEDEDVDPYWNQQKEVPMRDTPSINYEYRTGKKSID